MEAISEKQITDFIAQLRDDLATADKFLAMWRRRNQLPERPKGDTFPALGTNGDGDYGDVAKIVRDAINKCPIQYNVNDVDSAVRAAGHHLSRETIGQALNRFARAG